MDKRGGGGRTIGGEGLMVYFPLPSEFSTPLCHSLNQGAEELFAVTSLVMRQGPVMKCHIHALRSFQWHGIAAIDASELSSW